MQSNENETTQKVDQDAEQKQEGGSGSGGSHSYGKRGKGGDNGDSGQKQEIDQDADLDNDTEQKNKAEHVGSENHVVNLAIPIAVGKGNYAGSKQGNEANTYVVQSNENETEQKVDQDAEQKQDGGSGSGGSYSYDKGDKGDKGGKGGRNGDSGSQKQDIDQDADLDNDTEQKNEAKHVGSRNDGRERLRAGCHRLLDVLRLLPAQRGEHVRDPVEREQDEAEGRPGRRAAAERRLSLVTGRRQQRSGRRPVTGRPAPTTRRGLDG